jgi:hypothetical protein
MGKFVYTSRQAFLLFICLTYFSFGKAFSAEMCSDLKGANLKNQSANLTDLGDNLFSDPTNCAFPQVTPGSTTVNKGVTPQEIEKMLSGNPILSTFNNPKGDPKKIISDLFDKTQSASVKNKIDSMRAQLRCKNAEIEYLSDGPAQNIMNFKKSFTSNLSDADLEKYHKIDFSQYSKVGNVYTLKDTDQFNKEIEKFVQDKKNSDRPVFVCTEQQEMNFKSNTPNAQGIDFSDSFVTGLPELNDEAGVKEKICNSIKQMKPECVKSVKVSTSSDRRSNCDRSKNIINKDGENECPYVAGSLLGRNDFEKLSKDRADKLEKIVMSCSAELLKGKVSKDSLGARGDGSSGICPYEAINKEKHTTKIKPEYLKGGSSVADLNQNRYARLNIESTRSQGCEGYGKEVTETSTVSIKCIRIQVKCLK